MRVLSTLKYTALRMLRNYIVLLLLLVIPIILITIFSAILSGQVTESGIPYSYQNALTMVLTFQLFSGSLVMYLIHSDFFSAHRLRIRVLPFHQTMYAFSIGMCGVIYSILLGIVLMLYTQFVIGMTWLNWQWILLMITLIATLSCIVSLIFTFAVKNYKLAERLNDVYGIGFVVLAGLFFPLPKIALFDFFGSYGNPLTLSLMSIQAMHDSNVSAAWGYAGIMLAAIALLFMLMLALGRRKMA